METVQVTPYDHPLAILQHAIEFQESMLEATLLAQQLLDDHQEIPEPIQAVIAQARVVLEQARGEYQAVLLLQQAALITGNYREYRLQTN